MTFTQITFASKVDDLTIKSYGLKEYHLKFLKTYILIFSFVQRIVKRHEATSNKSSNDRTVSRILTEQSNVIKKFQRVIIELEYRVTLIFREENNRFVTKVDLDPPVKSLRRADRDRNTIILSTNHRQLNNIFNNLFFISLSFNASLDISSRDWSNSPRTRVPEIRRRGFMWKKKKIFAAWGPLRIKNPFLGRGNTL